MTGGNGRAPRPRYPSYRPSGVEWLGEIPAHWEVRRLRALGWLRAGVGFPESEQGVAGEAIPFYKVSDMNLEGNEVFMTNHNNSISVGTMRRLGASVFGKGSILFPKVGAALLTNKRRIVRQPACIDNNVMALTVRSGCTKYLYYSLVRVDMARLANPGAVPSINESQAREIAVAIPPFEEQVPIAAFLDREMARIDSLLAACAGPWTCCANTAPPSSPPR